MADHFGFADREPCLAWLRILNIGNRSFHLTQFRTGCTVRTSDQTYQGTEQTKWHTRKRTNGFHAKARSVIGSTLLPARVGSTGSRSLTIAHAAVWTSTAPQTVGAPSAPVASKFAAATDERRMGTQPPSMES